MKFSLERWGILEAIRDPKMLRRVLCGCLVGRVGVWDSQKLPNLMSRKKLGGSFGIVRNLGFERIVRLRGLYWIGGNLEGHFR